MCVCFGRHSRCGAAPSPHSPRSLMIGLLLVFFARVHFVGSHFLLRVPFEKAICHHFANSNSLCEYWIIPSFQNMYYSSQLRGTYLFVCPSCQMIGMTNCSHLDLKHFENAIYFSRGHERGRGYQGG